VGTPEISAPVMSLFEAYAWPGNVRQLANVLRTAAVMAGGERQICEHHLSDDFLEDVRRMRPAAEAPVVVPVPIPATPTTVARAPCSAPPMAAAAPGDAGAQVERAMGPIATRFTPLAPSQPEPDAACPRTLGEAEIEMIRQALSAAKGNISVASRRLGISRNTIYRKLRWGKGD
jgi:transcriptional regulator of acetoin/glycerol metabolism